MDTFYNSAKKHWQDSVNFALGLWVVASPWALGFTEVPYATGNAVIIGIVIAIMAAWALFAFEEWEEWANIILGLWLVATPWLFAFAAVTTTAGSGSAFVATWSFIVAGVLVAGLAIWSMYHTRKHGGPLAT